MLEHFRKFAKYGLISAPMLLPIILAERGHEVNLDEFADQISSVQNGNAEMPDMKDNPFVSENSKKKLDSRLRDVVIDMERLGYF